MTTQAQEGSIPELTLPWRLRMAMGDMRRDEMAASLGVDPGTISRWCAGKGAPPKRVYVMQWALITNTNLEWLETGTAGTEPTPPPSGRRGVRDEAGLARMAEERSRRSRRPTHEYVTEAA